MIPPTLAASYREKGIWSPETLPARLARICESNSGRIAILDGDRRLTFDEVATVVGRLAARFVAMGVRPGDVISWQLPGWWEAVVVHHAALAAGAIPNPLNPIYRAREMRFALGEARPRVLVVPATFRRYDHAAMASKLRSEVPSIEQIIVARGSSAGCLELDDLLASSATPSPVDARASDPALLLYTSGTTSDPKGVVHTHQTLLCEIESLRPVHALTEADRYLGGSPVAHIAGLVYGVLMPFALGTSTALMERWDPAAAIELIDREQVTFQTGAPAFLQTMAEHAGRTDTSSFHLFSTGGASIQTDAVRAAAARLGCVVKRAYGSTEVPTLTATRFEDPPELRDGTDGRVIAPGELRIVDGEIWARAPEQFIGYWNPALNAESDGGDGWFQTGDLGEVDGNGYLRVTGRTKDVIIRGGENISAKEIEDLLAEHPAVAEAAVIGVPDDVLGERACAVVVVRPGASLGFEEMTSYLSSKEIATQKLPERLELRKRLPKTASGKVLKTALKEELSKWT